MLSHISEGQPFQQCSQCKVTTVCILNEIIGSIENLSVAYETTVHCSLERLRLSLGIELYIGFKQI